MAFLDDERKRLDAYARSAGLTSLDTPGAGGTSLPRPTPPAAASATPATPAAPAAPAKPATPSPPAAPLGTRVGQRIRDVANTTLNVGSGFVNNAIANNEAAINTLTAPVRATAGFARDVVRAAGGLSPSENAGKPLAGLSLPRLGPVKLPSLANAGAPATPAAKKPKPATPALPRPAAPSSSAPVPGATPAQNAAVPTGGGGSAPGSRVLGTFTGRNGTRTITEADAQALAAKVPTASGPVVAGPNGSFAYGTGPAAATPAAAATTPGPAVAPPGIARPAAGPVGAVISAGPTAEQERAALVREIDAQLGRLPLNTRGNRALYAQLMAQRAGLTQQAGALASADTLSRRQADTSLATTQMSEEGAFGRTALTEQGQDRRTQMSLSRPEYLPDSAGVVNSITGGVARPVLGPDGQPLRTVTATQQRATESAAEQRQKTLESVAKAAEGFLPVGGQPTPQDIQNARLQAALLQGLQTATGPNGERAIVINGELVPL